MVVGCFRRCHLRRARKDMEHWQRRKLYVKLEDEGEEEETGRIVERVPTVPETPHHSDAVKGTSTTNWKITNNDMEFWRFEFLFPLPSFLLSSHWLLESDFCT